MLIIAKLFFNYSSVTGMLVDTGIPSFDAVVLNAKYSFDSKRYTSDSILVTQFVKVQVYNYYMFIVIIFKLPLSTVFIVSVSCVCLVCVFFFLWAVLPEIKLI